MRCSFHPIPSLSAELRLGADDAPGFGPEPVLSVTLDACRFDHVVEQLIGRLKVKVDIRAYSIVPKVLKGLESLVGNDGRVSVSYQCDRRRNGVLGSFDEWIRDPATRVDLTGDWHEKHILITGPSATQSIFTSSNDGSWPSTLEWWFSSSAPDLAAWAAGPRPLAPVSEALALARNVGSAILWVPRGAGSSVGILDAIDPRCPVRVACYGTSAGAIRSLANRDGCTMLLGRGFVKSTQGKEKGDCTKVADELFGDRWKQLKGPQLHAKFAIMDTARGPVTVVSSANWQARPQQRSEVYIVSVVPEVAEVFSGLYTRMWAGEVKQIKGREAVETVMPDPDDSVTRHDGEKEHEDHAVPTERKLKELEHLPEDEVLLGSADALQRQIIRLEEMVCLAIASRKPWSTPKQLGELNKVISDNAQSMAKVCDSHARVRALSHGPNQLMDAFVRALAKHLDPAQARKILQEARMLYEGGR